MPILPKAPLRGRQSLIWNIASFSFFEVYEEKYSWLLLIVVVAESSVAASP